MKKQPNTCKTCKYLQDLPFADTYICANENSNYADCDCDPDSDCCDEYEEED